MINDRNEFNQEEHKLNIKRLHYYNRIDFRPLMFILNEVLIIKIIID